MSEGWDSTRVKAQLRLTAQRLGQLQDRKDSIAHITSRDIATLLGQRNVSLARAKAQNLIKEDAMGDALQVLEMYCGAILERFSELESSALKVQPPTIEAAASIIHAAPYTESRDLMLVRELLAQRLGPEFAQSATHNIDGHVSPRILRALRYNPSAAELDAYLLKIARSFNVNWHPQMRPEEKIAVLSEMLDTSDIMGVVDMQKLRLIASSGIPNSPPWLRPRIWKLLFSLIPPAKVQWETEARTKRESYYDLVRRLLAQIPSTSSFDQTLLGLSESLAHVPAHLYSGLEDEPEQSSSCPLHDSAPEELKIACASALDSRLMALEDAEEESIGNTSTHSTPSIVLDIGSPPTSPDTNEFNQTQTQPQSIAQAQAPSPQRTLSLSSSSSLSPKSFRKIPAHHLHASSLLRILYIHSSLNPGHQSPNNASLLVPLYGVLNEEAEPSEAAHAEADAFWLFETLVKEIAELDEEDGGIVWMKRFSERVSTMDNELYEDLKLKGLDPALPQYSIRWLSPLLTHTVPLHSLLVAWDSIFAQPDSSRQGNPKLEHLLDICTAMLIRIRSQLFMLGKSGRKSSGLYGEDSALDSRSPLKPWELGNAFMEGMTLLQSYPLRQVGGIEIIIQAAGDILAQREEATKQPQNQGISIGSKIRDAVWKGLTNQSSSTEVSPESDDDDTEDDETESEANHVRHDRSDSLASNDSGWTARLKSTVWRGLTNQSALDVPPSPDSLSPSPSPSRERSPAPPPVPDKEKSVHLSPPNSATNSIWNYAAKLRQSDVAAKFSKVSTNISAKALDVWSAKSAPPSDGPSFDRQRSDSTAGTPVGKRLAEQTFEGYRRGSVPNIDRSDVYSPPPRPTFFRPPRDSRLFTHEEAMGLAAPESPESVTSAQSAPSPVSHSRTQSFARLAVLPSLSSLNPASPKPSKSAPRPLLLNPQSLVTPSPQNHVTRSANTTPTPQWTDVLRSRVQAPRHSDSISSMSSIHSGTVVSPKSVASGWDSDTSISRLVPLNRASMSPMAPGFRVTRSERNGSVSSQSEREGPFQSRAGLPMSPRDSSVRSRTPAEEETRSVRGWEQVAIPDSPSTLPSSPPPRTPVTSMLLSQQTVRVSIPDRNRGSAEFSEPAVPPLDPAPQSKRLQKKSVSPTSPQGVEDTSDSSVAQISPSSRTAPRLRAKRYGPQSRLSTLRLRDSGLQSPLSEQGALSPNTLAAPSFDAEIDLATTPKASAFPTSTSPTDGRTPRRSRKISTEGQEVRTRKISGDGRTTRPRKVSTTSFHRHTESAADEGDDEGYDELLSAYESEEGSRDGHAWTSEA